MQRSLFKVRPLALAVLMMVGAPLAAQTANPQPGKPVAIEIPAQPAAQALQSFLKQVDFHLLYAPELLRGLQSQAVSGVMSPRDALVRMLEGSGLQVVDTGPNAATLRPAPGSDRKPATPASAAAERRVEGAAAAQDEAAAAARPAATSRFYELTAGSTVEKLREFARLSGINVQFSEAELSGLRSPALSGDFTPRQALERLTANSGFSVGERVGTGEFVVRRVATIDRVEVTGSHLRSILGEQGVNPVTVLTRQDIERSGITTLADLRNLIPQLSVGASASFDGNSSRGATEARVLFDLRGLGAGNTLILVDGLRLPRTGSRTVAEAYEATGIPMSAIERVEVLTGGGSAIYGADAVGGVVNIITRKRYQGSEFEYARDNTVDGDAANDRLSLSHALRRGGFSARGSVSVETQNALALRDREWLASDDRRPWGGTDGTTSNAFLGGTVTLAAATGNLPGLSVRTANIPVLADGKTATIADYANAPATERYDAAKHLNALNPYKRSAANLHAEYEFSKWANVYADFSWSKNEAEATGNPVRIQNVLLPANYPGNPFGVAIRVDKYMWELGTPARHYELTQKTLAAGVRGDLPFDWRYRFSISEANSNPNSMEGTYQFNPVKLNAAIASSTPPILLQGMNAGAPNAAGVLEALYYKDAKEDDARTRTASLSFDGPVWHLPAGPVNLAVGVEHRIEAVKFFSDTSQSGIEANQPKDDRVVDAHYAELSLPLISPKSGFKLPLVHSLTVTGAVRNDSYSDFRGGSNKYLKGLMFKPVRWLALRATENEAFRVPYLIDLTRTRSTSSLAVLATGSNTLYDTYRKNDQVIGNISNTTGGNPNLKPEDSTHVNYGLLIESPFEVTKGLSFSVDRWSSDILNRVGTLNLQDRLTYFPETYTRADLTPADAAAGYTVGRITGVDNTSMNIARYVASGFDYSLRFQRRTSLGEFSFSSNITKTDKLQAFAKPGAAASTSVNARTRPTRSVSTVSWSVRGAGISLTAIRQSGFPTSATGVSYSSTLQLNGNIWYDYGTGNWHDKDGLIGKLLADTRISLGVINLTDKEPPLSSTGAVNNSIDPRLMRYTFTLRKRF